MANITATGTVASAFVATAFSSAEATASIASSDTGTKSCSYSSWGGFADSSVLDWLHSSAD